jgi:hypothetical protein
VHCALHGSSPFCQGQARRCAFMARRPTCSGCNC